MRGIVEDDEGIGGRGMADGGVVVCDSSSRDDEEALVRWKRGGAEEAGFLYDEADVDNDIE